MPTHVAISLILDMINEFKNILLNLLNREKKKMKRNLIHYQKNNKLRSHKNEIIHRLNSVRIHSFPAVLVLPNIFCVDQLGIEHKSDQYCQHLYIFLIDQNQIHRL